MRSKKHCILSPCRFSAFHTQTSEIFIGFLASSSAVRRQVESTRAVNPTSQPPVVHPASGIGCIYIFTLDESLFMVLLVDRLDHETIWLPDGDEVPDREKHMIQSPKLMLAFAWNPHGFQVVDVMSCHAKTRDVHGRLLYPKYSHRDRCLAWKEVKGSSFCMRTMQGHIQ
jgi:hypothetical protein